MNCPYCGKEMELGAIQSKKQLCWYPGDFHITGSAVRAYLCRGCEKIVIDCADGKCDYNKK